MLKKRQIAWKKIIGIIVLLASILAAVSKLFVGFDIDEGYALALPYRLLQGDHLFTQMWEVHQTSSLFAVLILYPYLAVAKTTTYLVLYVRIVCCVLHLLISMWVYRGVRLFVSRDRAAFLAAVYFNFLPKWMMSVDFSMQFHWFFTICILCLMHARFHQKNHNDRIAFGYMLACGVSLAFLVLGYPTMVLLYPVFLLLIFFQKGWEKKRKLQEALCVTAGCVIPAILFLGYLFSYMSVPELLENLSKVFSDGSHQFSGSSKWSLWIGHGRDVILQAAVTLLPAMVLAALMRFLYRRLSKNNGKQKEEASSARNHNENNVSLVLLTACVYILLTSLIVVIANLVGIPWGAFRLQIRYLMMFALGFPLVGKGEEHHKERWVRNACLYTSLVAFIGILLASNVGPASSSSYLIIGDMAMLWLVMTNVSESRRGLSAKSGNDLAGLEKLTLLVFLASVIMCKGYYVRVTEYPPSNILMERKQIDKGPAKGIYVYPSEYNEMTQTYELIRQNTTASDQVLYLGTQALSNLYTDGRMVLPTTISTPAFNEQWVEYFERDKDQMPTIIFLSRTTVEDQDKFFAKNPFGIWISEHYDVDNRTETEYLCVIER